jgi:16S rRNA (adenine(1408)-N(1))-methyltransferase
VALDIGTGDGRLPWELARRESDRLFIGLDANADNLREWSGRAVRARLANLLYVRAAAEDLPPELVGIADRVSVVLPWGSLLAAVARPAVDVLRGIRALCQQGAALTVVLGADAARDRKELQRLGLPPLDEAVRADHFAAAYAAAGFTLRRAAALPAQELTRYPSTWARQLAHGPGRRFIRIAAEAS